MEGTLKNGLKRNMVVYKMKTGGLFLHSVVALNKEAMKQLDSFGKPEIILIPNGHHTMDAGVFKTRYPGAKLLAPKSMHTLLQKKGLNIEEAAGDIPKETGIMPIVVPGFKQSGGLGIGGEMVFEVELNDGRAFVFCDLMTNNSEGKGLAKALLGGEFKCPRLIRWLLVKEKSKMKQWLLDMSGKEDVKAICVAHGKPIVDQSSQAFKDAAARSFS